jgi:replicative DNA helicase
MFDTLVKGEQKTASKKDNLTLPPYALDAEQSVIGGLLLDNQVWDVVSSKLTEADFYRHEHRVLFRVIDKLSTSEQPFDVITISDTLKSMDELDNVGGGNIPL